MMCFKTSMMHGGHILDNIIIFADTEKEALHLMLERYPKEIGYKYYSVNGSAAIEKGVMDV